MRKISVGFDLGVASVGWSVLDINTYEIIDKGVKLYTQANKAEDRRLARSLRRRYSRKNHRIERFIMLLNKYNIDYVNTTDNKLLEKRIAGINGEIDIQDLINILSFLLRFRGYYPTGEDTRENEYSNAYSELLPCEIQKIILEENGFYRGLEFPFLISEFEKEINKIFDNQIFDGSIVDENFRTEYLKIYKSKREFWEGPGGFREDQITPFGRCKTIEDVKLQLENENHNKFLFEQLIKDCSIYMGQKSVPVSNYYAQRFNFLNDMINISFKIEDVEKVQDKLYFVDDKKTLMKLKLDTINEFENEILNAKTVNLKSIFKKVLNIDIANVVGIRIEADKKPMITKFDAYKHVYYNLKIEDSSSLSFIENKDNWNTLAYIMTVYPNENCAAELEKNNIPSDVIEIVMSKTCNNKFEQRYHSYSQKALVKFIDLMESNLVNSSTIEKHYKEEINSDVLKDKVENYFNGSSYKMSTKYIDDLVASPQVKKTLRKAITTYNQIKKLYSTEKGYQIEYVVIESNKELLSAKKVTEYTNNMVGNTTKRKKAAELYPNDETKILKHLLLEETNHKCIYCGVNLTIDNVEVEHIIPLSISMDDSFANKAASCHSCNHAKGNMSPFKFKQRRGDFDKFKSEVEKLKISSEKSSNLLNISDINKYEKKFINRNLRDTSYATKEFINQFRIYNEALNFKGYENSFKLVSMPPKITGLVRKQYPKDREAKYHHAFDASIAAYYPLTKLGEISVMLNNDMDAYWRAPSFTAILSDIKSLQIKNSYFEKQLAEMDYANTKFHREIKKNFNGQLANADINKLIIDGNDNKKIEYKASIYDLEAKDLKKYFGEKSPLCMKHNDKKTFDFLVSIYNEYKDLKHQNSDNKMVEINPFMHYAMVQNDLTLVEEFKVAKHGIRPFNKANRPIIKKVNYTTNVTMPYVFDKKAINKKEGNNLMLDSLKTAYIKVYKEVKTDKFIFIPISKVCVDLKTGEINENHAYYKIIMEGLIGEKAVIEYKDNGKPMTLRTDEYVCVTKKNGEEKYALISHYDKSTKTVSLKKGHLHEKRVVIAASDQSIRKIPVYGLGAIGLNIE